MKATLTCPECSHEQDEEVPEKACVPFYICKGCNETIRAESECCVFCEHSDKKCPVAQ